MKRQLWRGLPLIYLTVPNYYLAMNYFAIHQFQKIIFLICSLTLQPDEKLQYTI